MAAKGPSKDVCAPQPCQDSDATRSVSERKLKANRSNALRSTGPKTTQGKRNSSRNAMKHGMLAQAAAITAGEGKESLEDFDALLEGLWDHYKPSGIVEEMLVEKIAVCWWKQARALRAEKGEIRKQRDTAGIDRAQRKSDQSNRALLFMSRELEPTGEMRESERNPKTYQGPAEGVSFDLRMHRSGLEFLRAILLNAKSEIASNDYISKTTRSRIFLTFSPWDYWFAAACDHFRGPEAKGQEPASEEIEEPSSLSATEKTRDEERAEVIALIDSRLQKVDSLQEWAIAHDRLHADAEALSLSLPDYNATDKILRYETHAERQFYRAMDQLERLQRQRKGENVPAPLNVNVSRRA